MKNFSNVYRGVRYFGLWAEEVADTYGIRDALNVLADAVGRCTIDDQRKRKDVKDALVFLSKRADRSVYVRRFSKALDEPDPVIRFRAANDALKALSRRINV